MPASFPFSAKRHEGEGAAPQRGAHEGGGSLAEGHGACEMTNEVRVPLIVDLEILEFPRFRGQSHYAACLATCKLSSNWMGLT